MPSLWLHKKCARTVSQRQIDLNLKGNQTGPAKDALGGRLSSRPGWTKGSREPLLEAGNLKVSDDEGALPAAATRW